MSTKRPWILTESQKACIHIHECDFLGELGFPWTYTVDVGGFAYPGKHTHPTRRAAVQAGHPNMLVGWMHRHHSYSWAHALQHEGYSVEAVTP